MTKEKKLYSFDDHPEHKAQLGDWAKKWIANAFATGEYSKDEITLYTQSVKDLYRAANLEIPPHIVFSKGPVTAASAYGISAGTWWLRENPQHHVELFGMNLAESMLYLAVKKACFKGVSERADRSTMETVCGAIDVSAETLLADTASVTNTAANASIDKVVEFLVLCTKNWSNGHNGGNQWSGYSAYLSFFRCVAKLDLDYSKWISYETLAHAGPRFMHSKFCIIAERPALLKVDDANRPHCEDGPFCAWNDGIELYYWRGVKVPKEWILDRKNIPVTAALTGLNIEQRRVAAELLGWKNVLKTLNAKTIQKDSDPQIGELIEVDLPDAPGSRFLQVQCATGREFCLPVPREMKTALEANAWTYDIHADVFKEVEVRT